MPPSRCYTQGVRSLNPHPFVEIAAVFLPDDGPTDRWSPHFYRSRGPRVRSHRPSLRVIRAELFDRPPQQPSQQVRLVPRYRQEHQHPRYHLRLDPTPFPGWDAGLGCCTDVVVKLASIAQYTCVGIAKLVTRTLDFLGLNIGTTTTPLTLCFPRAAC